MSITETVLTFVVIPAAIVLVVGGLSYAGGARRSSKRYRPGRPFDFAPVWFLSAPERLSAETGSAELTAGPHREAIAGATTPPAAPSPGEPAGVTGGASDRW